MNELVTEERSWWSRNWKWVVPVGGCFTFIIIGVLALGGAIFGFVKTIVLYHMGFLTRSPFAPTVRP